MDGGQPIPRHATSHACGFERLAGVRWPRPSAAWMPPMSLHGRIHGVSRTTHAGQPSDDTISQSASPRKRSLTEVLLRVFSSTCLTITAQYSEWLPSAAGSEPDTTTLYGGTEP